LGLNWVRFGFVFSVNLRLGAKNAENWVCFAKKGGFVEDSLHL
jgi:hypothetical protein